MKQQAQNDTVNLKFLFNKIASRWYLFVVFVPLALGGAYLYLRFTPKIFEVKASILIDDKSKDTPEQDRFIRGMGAFVPRTQLKDEVQLLTSFRYMKQVMDRLNMRVSYFSVDDYKTVEEYNDFPFRVKVDTTKAQMINVPIYIEKVGKDLYKVQITGKKVTVQDIQADRALDEIPEVKIQKVLKVGQTYTDKYLNFSIEFSRTPSLYDKDEYFFMINSLGQQAAFYQSNIKVNPIDDKNSSVIEISSRGPIIEKEEKVINTLLDVYLDNEVRKKDTEGKRTIAFIDNELGTVKDSIRRTDANNISVRTSSGVAGTTSEEISALNNQLQTYTVQLQEAQVKAEGYEALLRDLRNNKEVVGGVSGVDDGAVSNLLTQYSTLLQEKARLALTVQEGSVRMQQLDARLQSVKNALFDGLTNTRNLARIKVSSLLSQVNSIRGRMNMIPQTEVNILKVNRNKEVQDELYKYLLQKKADAGMALATNVANKEVIDRARGDINGPVAPKGSVIYLLAGIIGMAIPLGFIFIKDAFSDRISGQTDIQLNTNIPTLGVIGYNNKANTYLVANSSKSAIAESFRSVRVNLQYLFLDTSKKIIGVTSSQQAEGKTFCATNLAVVIAQSGKKTLLIDCDLRKPRVHTRFNVDNEKGLATYLTGMHDWEEVVSSTDTDNLSLVTSGPIPVSPLNLIGSPRMKALIDRLKKGDEYDYVIIDTAPLGLVSDFLILMNYTDFNVYIVRHKVTEREALNKINELYDTEKVKDIAIIINGVKSMSAYGYSDKAYKYSD
ncbi:polysaccharide biosynthesis tyrosine autokinase [Cytophagaceae bacterium DM2B3-1]|uniref:non-specific protein-tyrosine kinase n=1 Tax=Xanthocytophaga flava TaxID=3048013 RepID=A0ABT7CLM6_9BACT|nr:polysaccharide biosynthesis tyrosine autokinase [Xanthocytophaga flavus]MDJ1468281.1 polysaccharide biosynthesis tyrosine autokinase [Xanthocytophaga flavus]MDJ1494648.1 polysaccharide biosynthesis tyrosine autokinase [Xanthocytophaga flavus]